MWDLVGKSFEIQAVLKPASERPKAAYTKQKLIGLASNLTTKINLDLL